jgi:hypothetical protein
LELFGGKSAEEDLTNAAAIEEHGAVIPLVEFGEEACQCYKEHTVQKSLITPGQ